MRGCVKCWEYQRTCLVTEFRVAKIHIFGLNHFLQNCDSKCWTESGRADEQDQKSALGDFLRQIIPANRIEHIAEEAKFEAPCLGGKLAQEFGIAYSNITMPLDERQRHGVRTPDYDRDPADRQAAYRVFERFMFERVKGRRHEAVLVLCGRRHLQPLVDQFQAAGDDVRVYDVYDYEWYRGLPLETSDGVRGYDREDN